MPLRSDPARNADILTRRADGETLDTIAKAHGITRERVRQIIEQNNGTTANEIRDRHRARRAEQQQQQQQALDNLHTRIRAHIRANPTATVDEVAATLGTTKPRIWLATKGHPERLTLRAPTTIRPDGTGLTALQEIFAENGPLTAKRYDEVRRGRGLSAMSLHIRYGSWNNALTAAGLTPTRRHHQRRSDRFDSETIITGIAQYLETGQDTSAGYARWARATGKASLSTVRVHFRSWGEAKNLAAQHLHR